MGKGCDHQHMFLSFNQVDLDNLLTILIIMTGDVLKNIFCPG